VTAAPAPPAFQPAYQPASFELRMLGAIMFQCIRDAWRLGQDRVRFRGYCIEARRIDSDGATSPHLVLTLRVAGAPGVIDRMLIAVAPRLSSGTRCDIRMQVVRHRPLRRAESPVGCVSPIDARNASPETGQIS
jgi:hypothetical protein